MEREIIHVDIAAFAVAVERIVQPALRGRPVLVAPVGASRPVVTELSGEAWEAGVRRGMPLARALRYCREAAVLPPNEPLYERASRALCRILAGYSPVLEPAGHGHAYLDVTGCGRLLGPSRDAAWRIQREIRGQLRLESSLGVASNKLVSRIASVVTRPAGLHDVRPGDEACFLSPLPVRLLPGVGAEAARQLAELNVRLVRELAQVRLDHLTLAFGRLGLLLRQRALGIDHTPVYPPRELPAVEERQTLPEDSNDWGTLRRVLSGLCDRAGERLRAQGQRGGRLELRVRYSDGREGRGGERLSPPLQSGAPIHARASALLERVLTRRTRVRSLCLSFGELVRGPVQLDLFAGAGRQERLDAALDLLRRRHGGAVVFRPAA